ncbi:nicotinate-nucleotide--dimethylbenzimidazole phosphoribosyltransferase [Butyrivibrio sp. CB08]|uniref:nicotinate-nucleotide--dimethylbenzimidazole phosphoribosyltransferase n=1 Tax=Butyrivibrio sp. CB08 TaxID=2364879 RepID=UPI000EA90F3F|nr:nicotinate-nucleotide--dimethylbenzimidazole phosphoribosyltransferase [Butyrivibrio sp. CB08]RKM59753.1 nicotinate-nucleotide--dimethylbenzimidazole phosphoribosyltransferase [Butyrivibrio sp. CB08]
MLTREKLSKLNIEPPSAAIYQASRDKWDGISKPIDGLGDFEKVVARIAAIQGTVAPSLDKRAAVIMCSDNGVVEEGISQTGKEITKAVAAALGSGISTACTLGRSAKVDIIPVDMGIDCDETIDGVIDLKVRKGTRNFVKEPAMTEDETLLAIERGIELTKDLAAKGYKVIATGEMGIGNTTTSAGVLSALLHEDSEEIVGRGSGLDDAGLSRKREVVKAAVNKYGAGDALEILACLGGYDIAGLCGLCIGAALSHLPVVVDGVISTTAALVAERLVPGVKEYVIPSHAGREKGNLMALGKLGLAPLIEGNMALGEGTGAIMLFPLLDVVMDYYLGGAEFSDYSIDEYKRIN